MSLSNSLPLFFAYLFGAFLVLLLGPKGKEKENEPYSFLRFFPYELYGDSRGAFRLFARLGEIITLLADGALPLFLLLNYHNALAGEVPSYLTGLMIFTVLFILSYFLLTLIPASAEKAHLSLFFSSAALSTMSLTMEGFLLIILIRSVSGKGLLYIIVSLLFVLALATIVLPLNPKMKHWAELERVNERDGTQSYRRPHLFILAFSEWLLTLFRSVGFLLALIGFLIVAM